MPEHYLRKELKIKTKAKKEVIDITDEINAILEKSEKKDGLCHIFLTHTTCCLTTADLDPGTDLDMLDAFGAMIPKLNYRHPHDPSHVPDHILSSLIGTSVLLPFENKNLVLGTWQRVVLIEFDGPRERRIVLTIF
jgi:secondary thiamine-phosphate synthase enzyme